MIFETCLIQLSEFQFMVGLHFPMSLQNMDKTRLKRKYYFHSFLCLFNLSKQVIEETSFVIIICLSFSVEI